MMEKNTKHTRIFSVGLMISNPENGFQKAMRKVATGGYMDMPCSTNYDFNEALLREVRNFKPDIVFMQFQQEGIITEETASELAKIAFVINFSGDVRQQLPSWYIKIGKHIQLSTFTNMVDVDKCRVAGVNADYLEIGVDISIFKSRPEIKKQSPSIVAHFNHYENMFPLSGYRMEIVERMKKEFGQSFGIFGNFPNSDGNFNHSQIEESMNYNRALLFLNVSHFNFNRYASDRMLRGLASGCMALSHNFTGIELDYNVGEHLDVFNDLDELVEKCNYYLANTTQRELIAKNGHDFVHKNHSFESMCLNMVKLFHEHKNNNNG